MRIIFTGGSGKAGRHVIPYLVEQGHEILNLDLVPLNHPGVLDLKVDLTDSGQVFNAFSGQFNFADFDLASRPAPATAVIHFAAVARNLLVPDNTCFTQNVTATYNVIEAACKLGIRKIITCSSETTYGVCFAQGPYPLYQQFPLDEDTYDVNPMDSYALSKICGEKTARSFARRYADNGADIYVLRVGNVVEPHEYERDFPGYLKDPVKTRYRNAYSYIDARDLGQICDLAVKKDGLGFQLFNATNDTITTREPTVKFLTEHHPEIKIVREMGEWEAPLSNKKVKEVLGFKEQHNWRQYVKT